MSPLPTHERGCGFMALLLLEYKKKEAADKNKSL